MGKTSIEWTRGDDGSAGATWNPVRGCSRISPGCGGANHQGGCYAEKIAARFSDPGMPFHGFAERSAHGGRWTGKMAVVWEMVDQPIRWRKPRRIFANSMSDLWHKDLPREDVAMVYGTAIAAVHLRGHTIQILTKRSDHMRELLNDVAFWDIANDEAGRLVLEHTDPLMRRSEDARATLDDYGPDKPPPGIWLGVSVEDQQRADERIPDLLATPAAVRFLSCEPLLGPVDLRKVGWRGTTVHALIGDPKVHWVIAGGESGPQARPSHPDWFRSLRDQCQVADIPFFFKQWGEWIDWRQAGASSWINTTPQSASYKGPTAGSLSYRGADLFDGASFPTIHPDGEGPIMVRVGKKAAGALLDGREWREFPA